MRPSTEPIVIPICREIQNGWLFEKSLMVGLAIVTIRVGRRRLELIIEEQPTVEQQRAA